MRVACIQYKSYESEKKTLKKIIPLIYTAAKKKSRSYYIARMCHFFKLE